MICPYCGKETKDDALFCASCGHKITQCPACNRVLRTNARFCGFDGTALPPELLVDLPAPKAAPVPPRHSPTPVTPEQTKERSKLPIILGAVLIVLLLAGIVVGVGVWQGWFSSSRSTDEEETLSVSAGEAGDQSEASEDDEVAAADSMTQSEEAVQSETGDEAEIDAAQSSEPATEIEAQSDAEAEQIEVPVSERTYEIVASDLSWSEANEAAREAGAIWRPSPPRRSMTSSALWRTKAG